MSSEQDLLSKVLPQRPVNQIDLNTPYGLLYPTISEFDRTGRYLAVGSTGGHILVYNSFTKSLVRALHPLESAVVSLHWSPWTTSIVASDDHGNVTWMWIKEDIRLHPDTAPQGPQEKRFPLSVFSAVPSDKEVEASRVYPCPSVLPPGAKSRFGAATEEHDEAWRRKCAFALKFNPPPRVMRTLRTEALFLSETALVAVVYARFVCFVPFVVLAAFAPAEGPAAARVRRVPFSLPFKNTASSLFGVAVQRLEGEPGAVHALLATRDSVLSYRLDFPVALPDDPNAQALDVPLPEPARTLPDVDSVTGPHLFALSSVGNVRFMKDAHVIPSRASSQLVVVFDNHVRFYVPSRGGELSATMAKLLARADPQAVRACMAPDATPDDLAPFFGPCVQRFGTSILKSKPLQFLASPCGRLVLIVRNHMVQALNSLHGAIVRTYNVTVSHSFAHLCCSPPLIDTPRDVYCDIFRERPFQPLRFASIFAERSSVFLWGAVIAQSYAALVAGFIPLEKNKRYDEREDEFDWEPDAELYPPEHAPRYIDEVPTLGISRQLPEAAQDLEEARGARIDICGAWTDSRGAVCGAGVRGAALGTGPAQFRPAE